MDRLMLVIDVGADEYVPSVVGLVSLEEALLS